MLELKIIIGTLAGIFTTIAFIPQVVKTWRSRSAGDISLWMFLLFSSGVLLWLIYGLMLRAMPVIVANAVTLALSVSILYLKLRDMLVQRRRKVAADRRGL